MVNKCMNRCSTLLVFRQIKITVRGHFTLTKMAKIKKTVKKKGDGNGAEKMELIYIAGRNIR